MFKTILKIAVLSATAITLLSACGAAKKALGSAADDALNAALAKAEKRYEKRYTEAISNLTDDNGDPLKVYIDDDGTPFHVTIDENGDPIKVPIDDKINPIKAKTDDKGNPIQVTIDDKGNPIQVNIDDKGNPIQVTIDDKSDPLLTVAVDPKTAEICSRIDVQSLHQSPCDNDAASIQRLHESCLGFPWYWRCAEDDRYELARHEYCLDDPFWWAGYGCKFDDRYKSERHEYCLNNPFWWECGDYKDARHEICLNDPFSIGCAHHDRYDDVRHEHCLNNPFSRQCVEDNRYQNARLETCADNFSVECVDGGLEFYSVRIKFCNKPANAGHDACRVASEPQVDSEGRTKNEFLQGTADGLNTGSLLGYHSHATALPVVHILKLSDSDDGVAFFAGVAPEGGYYRYYAGILPDPNLGAPITQTRGTATWQGTFSVITTTTTPASTAYALSLSRIDKDFDLEIDFATKQLSASINGVKNTYRDYNVYNDYNTWELTHTDYRLSGVFADGKIEGRLEATRFRKYSDDGFWTRGARVQGLIGQDGAIGVFVDDTIVNFSSKNSFSGGFVARPPSK